MKKPVKILAMIAYVSITCFSFTFPNMGLFVIQPPTSPSSGTSITPMDPPTRSMDGTSLNMTPPINPVMPGTSVPAVGNTNGAGGVSGAGNFNPSGGQDSTRSFKPNTTNPNSVTPGSPAY